SCPTAASARRRGLPFLPSSFAKKLLVTTTVSCFFSSLMRVPLLSCVGPGPEKQRPDHRGGDEQLKTDLETAPRLVQRVARAFPELTEPLAEPLQGCGGPRKGGRKRLLFLLHDRGLDLAQRVQHGELLRRPLDRVTRLVLVLD